MPVMPMTSLRLAALAVLLAAVGVPATVAACSSGDSSGCLLPPNPVTGPTSIGDASCSRYAAQTCGYLGTGATSVTGTATCSGGFSTCGSGGLGATGGEAAGAGG